MILCSIIIDLKDTHVPQLLSATNSDVCKWYLYTYIVGTFFKKIMRFERKVFRNIYGPRFNQGTNIIETKKRKFYKPDIWSFIRNKRVKWISHTWRADDKLLVKKINRTIPLDRSKTQWIYVVAKNPRATDQNATFKTGYNWGR